MSLIFYPKMVFEIASVDMITKYLCIVLLATIKRYSYAENCRNLQGKGMVKVKG